jgi:hypothetical protein
MYKKAAFRAAFLIRQFAKSEQVLRRYFFVQSLNDNVLPQNLTPSVQSNAPKKARISSQQTVENLTYKII